MLMWTEAKNVVIKKCLVHRKKKVSDIPVPSRIVTIPNSPWEGIIEIFPPRDSLVSGIRPGTGMSLTSFLQCIAHLGASQYNVIPLVHGSVQSQGLQSGTHCCQVLFPTAKVS
jgi:hypothetical protein